MNRGEKFIKIRFDEISDNPDSVMKNKQAGNAVQGEGSRQAVPFSYRKIAFIIGQ